MPFITIGTTSQLQIKVPTRGSTNWDETLRTDTFLKIAEHDHTGSAGKGIQLGTGSITADAITGAKIRLDNAEYLRSRNAADSGDINVIRVDANDIIQLGVSVIAPTIGDATDATKALTWTLDGATTAKTLTLDSNHTDNRTLTYPDATDTLVGRATTDTLTNKTLSGVIISSPTTLDVSDAVFSIQGSSDATKEVRFEVDGLTTGNIRTLTVQDSSDTLVGRDTTDTLTNKTLTSPVINSPTTLDVSDAVFSIQDNADATKEVRFQASGITTGTIRTLTVQDSDDTIVGRATTDVLTNKSIDSDNNTITNIVNADIKAAAAIAVDKLAALTASEIAISDGSGFLTSAAVATYPSLTELTYLKGVTSAAQTQIDGKLPTTITTTGDIIYSSSGTTAARLGVGSNGDVLTLSAGLPSWAVPAVAVKTHTSKTTTYTVTTSDDFVDADASGGAFTLTLYAVSGNAGKEVVVTKTDSSTGIVTIDGNAAETINGAASITLNTQYESVKLYCNGSSWSVLSHKCNTEWTSYTMVIDAVTTAPTKGTVDEDEARWRRVGDSLEVIYNYSQTGAGSAGSGAYRFQLPNNGTWTIDTAKMSTEGAGSGDTKCGFGIGSSASNGVNSTTQPTVCIPHSDVADTIGMYRQPDSGAAQQSNFSSEIGSAVFALNTTTVGFYFRVTVPITGWGQY